MTEEKKVTIEVDGKALRVTAGANLIDVTDAAGIPVPRFCYHKKLSVSANCRMCLVEVEKVPKPLPACATPVNEGMKIWTRSPRALAAQKGTMEFLLINHPLDCPICDQGGECELQDVALGYGGDVSRFAERKRVVKDHDIGPLIATDMTRCIHCTRCVRFGAEIAGIREMGAVGRGEHMRIGTYIERSIDSELSGNIIDLCPVGALTSKPFRFSARAWELTQCDGVAPHDAVGSNLHLHIRDNKVMRIHPRDNESINECWISDRDRFSYQGLYSNNRLQGPLIKQDNQWRDIEWEEVLERVADQLKAVTTADPDQLAVLASPTATLEELYLLQKLCRGLGSGNIDHRLRQGDFRGDAADPRYPWLGLPIANLEKLDAALLIGSNVRKDQPIFGHRLRKAVTDGGAHIAFVNPLQIDLNFDADQLVSSPAAMIDQLAAIASVLQIGLTGELGNRISKAKVDAIHRRQAEKLKNGASAAVFLGGLAMAHPDFAVLRRLATAIAEAAGATLGYLPEAANSVGARLAGVVPHAGPGAAAAATEGEAVAGMLENPRQAYVLFGAEPGADFWNPSAATRAMDQAKLVVALTAFRTPSLEQTADIMLPLAGFAETAGTFVNAEGRWQGFHGVVRPVGQARPGWKILRVLGNLLGLDGFDYVGSDEIRAELENLCEGMTPDNELQGELNVDPAFTEDELIRVGDVPIYATDALVRQAEALQATKDGDPAEIAINANVAEKFGLADAVEAMLEQNGARVRLPLRVDHRVPDGCAWIPAGVAGTERLGGQYGPVKLEKV